MTRFENYSVKEEIAEASTSFTEQEGVKQCSGDEPLDITQQGQVTDMECCEIRPEDKPNSEAVGDHVSMAGSEACTTGLLETLPEEQYHVNYYDAISPVKLEFHDGENIEREDHSWLERSRDTDSSFNDHVNIEFKMEKDLNLKRKLIVFEDEEEFIAKFGDPGANNASNALRVERLSYTSTLTSSQSGAPPAKKIKTTRILKKQNKEDIRARVASTACLLIEKKYKKVVVDEGMNQNAKRTSTLHKNKQRAKRIIKSTNTSKLFVCDNCSYKCNEKSKLILHMRKHADEKPFACDFCAYRCRDRSTLTKHRRTHTGDKPYACSKCAYRSTIMHGLKVHYRIHTGAKPFTCKTCNFKFRDQSGLKKHSRIHTGEKPYGCNLCAYKSAHKQSVMLHIRLHTGEKPYACSICNKTYVSVGRLINHKRACFWKLGPTRG